jgi:hypothetical protein
VTKRGPGSSSSGAPAAVAAKPALSTTAAPDVPVEGGSDALEALVSAAIASLQSTPAAPAAPDTSIPGPRRLGACHAAAAVVATFERASLQSVAAGLTGFENDAEDGGIDAVIRNSKLVSSGSRERWALRPDVRRDILARLGSVQRIGEVLAANPDRDLDDPAQRMFEAYLRGDAPALDAQDIRALTGTLQVLDWLDGVGIVKGLPAREAVRRRADLMTLLEPFSELAGTHFAGRQQELAQLRSYVGVLPPGSLIERAKRIAEAIFDLREKPPLVVWGVGGVGKSTLVARFILEHATLDNAERFPWAYIDFDRPGMLAEDPLTLLVEAVRQLGIQYPDASAFTARVRDRWLQMLRDRPPQIRLAMTRSIELQDSVNAVRLVPKDVLVHCLVEFADLLNNLKVETSPLLLVLDTFEQVQYRSSIVVSELMGFLALFQRHVPRLRAVIAGRAPVGDVVGIPTQALELGDFDADAAQAYLSRKGVSSPELARRIYSIVGGSPMSLRLAAETYRQTGAVPDDLRSRGLFGLRIQDNQIQAQLFARILNHIHDPDVRKLAHPGMILRRVTPAIIREVLAKPCGVALETRDAEQRLFDEMAREVSLIRMEDGALHYRADVRSIVLPLIRATQPERARQIAEAAVTFYEARDGSYGADSDARLLGRAEELYHRLFLGQPAEVLDSRWMAGADRYLGSALEELPLRERAWLASRLGRSLSAEERSEVAQDGWERDTLRRARDLLRNDKPEQALAAIQERPQRLAGSPLFGAEAEALERLERFADMKAIAEAGIDSADAAGERDLAIALRLRSARADLHDGTRLPEARIRLAEAEALATDIAPLRVVEVRLHRLALARAEKGATPGAADDVRPALLRDFDALTDSEVIDQGPLTAWLAAELAATVPRVLARVLRLTGVPRAGARRLRELALALTSWDAAQPTPGEFADRAGAAAADSLTERWTRFVLSTPSAELGAVLADLIEKSTAAPPAAVIDSLAKTMLARARGLLVPGDVLDLASRDPIEDEMAELANAARSAISVQSVRLTGAERAELRHVLLQAFPTRHALFQTTLHRLGRNIESLALSDDLQSVALRLIQTAEAEGWVESLIVAARESNPTHAALHRFAEKFGLAPSATAGAERLLKDTGQLELWRSALGQVETQICRVEMAGIPAGNGFLVGPDLVLTAHHCVQAAIEQERPEEIAFRFDQRVSGSKVVSSGTVYAPAGADWLVSHVAPTAPPASGSLDYALVRLSRPAGAEPVGGDRAEPDAPPRRWLDLLSSAEPRSGALLIVYYSRGQPMKLALSERFERNAGVIEFFGNTTPGASGAPCFDAQWKLAGMVVGRSPQQRAALVSPIEAIVASIGDAGSAGLMQVLA